jgi:hypothetical protein
VVKHSYVFSLYVKPTLVSGDGVVLSLLLYCSWRRWFLHNGSFLHDDERVDTTSL